MAEMTKAMAADPVSLRAMVEEGLALWGSAHAYSVNGLATLVLANEVRETREQLCQRLDKLIEIACQAATKG